jgi:hypothetical protein
MTTQTQHRGRGIDTTALATPTGAFVELDGESMYVIRDFDRMPSFLMSIVSDSDHWMYISTGGALAAGRVDADRSLFPYETDDRLFRAGGATGPRTNLRIMRDGEPEILWEPLTDRMRPASARRNVYKSVLGNSVVFEEIREDLGLSFRYKWETSSEYGFVRTATLTRISQDPARIEVVDGLLNLVPANVPLGLQQSSSTLVEAYRRNEVDAATGLAIFSLEARITDRPEPAESMHANIAWSMGLPSPTVTLSSDAIRAFRAGRDWLPRTLVRGSRAHYIVSATIDLRETQSMSWRIVADVYQSHHQVERRRAGLLDQSITANDISDHVGAGTRRLRSLIGAADGHQSTGDRLATTHHYANTLFNSMRGGVFVDNGAVPVDDFAQFLETRNRAVHRTHAAWLASLGERTDHRALVARASQRGDVDLERLAYEYLPITFSRRHGDPSRPWNRFAIRVRGEDGSRLLDYQGNWRDIFQNWEALCYSFPDYLESIVVKFVNASTVDGFNPYRVTREGIDWEVPDPEDPWSNIGYWGDHQIVYMLRLLEASEAFHPDALPRLLNRTMFSYADIPYRLRPYDAIVRNNKATIDFDVAHAHDVEERATFIGSDGKLILDDDSNVLHVTLAEKLIVPMLSKLSNLVVDGGIWMNTQRPEWNDANNALVGNGVSMVTLAYLRRYLEHCERLFAAHAPRDLAISTEVVRWLEQTVWILTEYRDRLDEPDVSDRRRKRLLDALGAAFSEYRSTVYEHGFSGKSTVPTQKVIDLCRVGRDYADHTIRANRRSSGLYHAYNLIRMYDEARELGIERLPEMLEGQVAVISSGVLESQEVLEIIDAMYSSPLYREDQDSFMLYPAVELPGFLERNTIASDQVDANPLLTALIEAGNTAVVQRDALGNHRFSPSITSIDDLTGALDHLSANPKWTELIAAHRHDVSDTFERVFHHKRFTGRSGSMYKFEGLGSIYWHMVSKLLLAVQEAFWRAHTGKEDTATIERLADAYYRVRSGLSTDKAPAEYGAFPTDPYSHSPGHMGAQQPGMTGQVKEEILTRWGELGVRIVNGSIRFDPVLLRLREFIDGERPWTFVDVADVEQTIALPAGSLGFTYCQVPIVYRLVDGAMEITVTLADGSTTSVAGSSLDGDTSEAIFRRHGTVALIEVGVPRETITRD